MKSEQIPLFPQEQSSVPLQNPESKPKEPFDGMKDVGLDGRPVVWREREGINGNKILIREPDEESVVPVGGETVDEKEIYCDICNDAEGGCPQCGSRRNKRK